MTDFLDAPTVLSTVEHSMRILARFVFRFAFAFVVCLHFETAARADEAWRAAYAAHQRGDFNLAISEYTKAIDVRVYILRSFKGAGVGMPLPPNMTQVPIELARLYWMRGKARLLNHGIRLNDDQLLLRVALEDFAASINQDGTNAEIYNDRGTIYARLGQHESALTDFAAAIALRRDYFLPYNNRCLVYAKLGRRAEAIADCQKATELDPAHWQPRRTLERLDADR